MLWVAEFGAIKLGDTNRVLPGGDLELCKDEFDSLITLTRPLVESEVDQVLTLFRRNGKDYLKVRNYVGVIRTPSGLQIEILPKLSKASTDIASTRALLIKMLRSLRNSPFKQIQTASLDVHEMPLFELLIRAFLDEVLLITKRGVARAYKEVRGEQQFVRGKLLVFEKILKSSVNRATVLCEYDEFSVNRSVNRVVKSALSTVSKCSTDFQNLRLCKQLQHVFAEVPASKNWRSDFSKVRLDRYARHYSDAMVLCELILKSMNPLTQQGSKGLFALLYPMERVFENYVASKLKRQFPDFYLRTQDTSHHMINAIGDSTHRAFNLQPDLVLSNKDCMYVADTKWKLIDDSAQQSNISQSDIYQLFAYGEKYVQDGMGAVILIYPKSELFSEPLPAHWFDLDKDRALYVLPFDLDKGVLAIDKSIPVLSEYCSSRNNMT